MKLTLPYGIVKIGTGSTEVCDIQAKFSQTFFHLYAVEAIRRVDDSLYYGHNTVPRKKCQKLLFVETIVRAKQENTKLIEIYG
jgi:hypothetical protein